MVYENVTRSMPFTLHRSACFSCTGECCFNQHSTISMFGRLTGPCSGIPQGAALVKKLFPEQSLPRWPWARGFLCFRDYLQSPASFGLDGRSNAHSTFPQCQVLPCVEREKPGRTPRPQPLDGSWQQEEQGEIWKVEGTQGLSTGWWLLQLFHPLPHHHYRWQLQNCGSFLGNPRGPLPQ